ncbi:Gldg family protein [Niabella sp. 22666]|uniref:Gldg family protein n=1 Tax=Niabella sp. 22666 TaxID=3453954 RepID=UPI003F82F0B1
MKLIFKIAKNELRHLFYTPVAWFLLIVFWVLCAFFYEGHFYRLGIRMYNVLKEYPEMVYTSPGTLTGFITSPLGSVCASLLQYLYLFIPLLTMSVISREFNRGSFKLLYASPIRLRQLVIGKYLGLSIFNLLFLLILGVFMITAAFDIKSIDTGILLSAVIGIFLLLSTYAAIGYFASSLTRYPIVAALISFAILTVLANIHQVWQQYDVVRDLTSFLSLKSRTTRMLSGLMTTKDIIYFLVVIVMFIFFTLLVLKGKMQKVSWYLKAGRYLAIITIALGIGYISSRQSLTGYLDTSARKINTLYFDTQKNLELLKAAPLEVTLYTNLFDEQLIGLPGNRPSYLDKWEPYRRFKKDIYFKYVYYYAHPPGDSSLYKMFPGKTLKQIAGLRAKILQVDSSLFISPEAVSKIVDLNKINYGVATRLSWKGRSEFIDYFPTETGSSLFVDQAQTSEPAFNAAFRRLSGARMPKLGFITGQLERSVLKTGEREYGWLNSLYALGFDGDTLNLATQEIPADMTTLILADPRRELGQVVKEKLNGYLRGGGNMFIMGEPGKQQVLNPILQQLGVQLLPGQLVQPNQHETADKILVDKSTKAYWLAKEYMNLPYQNLLKHRNNNALRQDIVGAPGTMAGAAGLDYNKDSGFVIHPLLITQPGKSWKEMSKLVMDSTAPAFDPLEGDVQDTSFAVTVQLTRPYNGKEQRLVVAGDADFVSMLRSGVFGRDFIRSVFSWLNYNQYPIYTAFPMPQDNILTMTPAWAKLEKVLYIWIIPSLLLLLGIALLTRRKRK